MWISELKILARPRTVRLCSERLKPPKTSLITSSISDMWYRKQQRPPSDVGDTGVSAAEQPENSLFSWTVRFANPSTSFLFLWAAYTDSKHHQYIITMYKHFLRRDEEIFLMNVSTKAQNVLWTLETAAITFPPKHTRQKTFSSTEETGCTSSLLALI